MRSDILNTFGKNIKITMWGTSHGPEIGIAIDGLPAGIAIDDDLIRAGLAKRRPQSTLSTPRSEPDVFEIVSGVAAGRTDGSSVRFVIKNTDVRSVDYDSLKHTPRPGHADFPAYVKSHGTEDLRGGGIHSGRITSLFMIVGAIAKQILTPKGIRVGSHILSVKDAEDAAFDPVKVDPACLEALEANLFPVLDLAIEPIMKNLITLARDARDSVGGIVETAIVGLPVGLGEPLFWSLESQLAAVLYAVPAVKGVAFGDGFGITKRAGSEVRDEYVYTPEGTVKTLANHNGGIVGGMATGMPVIVRTAVKPTASIGIPQRSVNLETHENTTIEIVGRHDPAIVNRAVHVINAAIYYALLDMLAEGKPETWFR